MQAELWEKEITIRKKDDTIREKEMTIREKEDIIREKEDIIREKEDIIREKEDIIREKEDIIRKKENTIREKEDLIWKSENDIRGHKDVIKEKHEELKKANCDVQQLKEVLARKDEEIKTLKKIQEDLKKLKIMSLESTRLHYYSIFDEQYQSKLQLENSVNEKVVELQKENKELESQVQEVNGEMAELQKENKELKTQVKNVTDQMVGLQNKTEALKSEVQRKKDYIKELKKDNVYSKECYIKINEVFEKANSRIEQLEEYLTKKDDEIKSLKKLREEMKQLEEDLIKKDEEITSLKAINIMLQDDVQKQVQKKQNLEEVHQAKLKQLCSQLTEIENLRCEKDALIESYKKLKSEKDALTENYKKLKSDNDALNKGLEILKCDRDALTRSNEQLKRDISDTLKKTDATSKEHEKQIKQLKKDLGKEKEEHKADIQAKEKLLKKINEKHQKVVNDLQKQIQSFQNDCTKLREKNDRLSKIEQAYNVTSQIVKSLQSTLSDKEITINRQQSKIHSLQRSIDWYHNENESKHRMIASLEDEKETLLLRLNKITGAQLTYNNPNIADLSDDKRPSKLAEKFSELYDNEWTDAFECIEADHDHEKSNVLYDLLKRSYEFCETLSTGHNEAIIKSFITLNYTVKFHKQNINVKNSNMLSDRQDITDEVRTSANKENDSMDQTVKNYRQSSFKNTARSKPPSEKQHSEAEVTADTKELLIAERECVEKRNDVTEVTVSELMFNFDDFSAEQKKNLLDLRKLCEEKQANDVVQVGSKLVATEMQIENCEIMKYLSKCIDICWSMCRHTPPVFIDYSKCEEGLPFDQQKYRPYTKSGKFVHFVVWPTLYLHKGGPQLSKGVAQGRN